MYLITKLHSSFLFGLATSKYVQGKFKKAAHLYEKAISIDPKSNDIEYSYLCLGRCYKEIGQYQDAFNYFSKAYEIYRKKQPIFKNDFEKNEVKNMLITYMSMLKGFREDEKAKEVLIESKKLGLTFDREDNERTSYHILSKNRRE